MENSTSRFLVGSALKRALETLKADPERGIRNLVDLALQFSDGRFQREFFAAARTMLEKDDSAYYALVRDTVAYADTDRLFTLGMDLGYNGCTLGARRIREQKAATGVRLPWTISLRLDAERFQRHAEEYHAAVGEGERLGIYVWMLFAPAGSQALLPLAAAHPDSAFLLFCEPEDVTAAFLDGAAALHNLMPVVRYDETDLDPYAALRKAKMLYSVWRPYGPEDLDAILRGDLFRAAQRVSPVFTALSPGEDCPAPARELAYQAVKQARAEQRWRTIPWELRGDTRAVGAVISGAADPVCFDEDGDLRAEGEKIERERDNLFQSGLTDILMDACLGEVAV